MSKLETFFENNLKVIDEIKEELHELTKDNQNDQDLKFIDDINSILSSYIFIKTSNYEDYEKDDVHAKLIIKLFDTLYPEFVNQFESQSNKSNEFQVKKFGLVNMILGDITSSLCSQAYDSLKFCKLFLESNGLSILLKYINNQILLEKYKTADSESSEFENLHQVLNIMILALISLGRECSNYKNQWKQNNSVKSLLNYLNYTQDIADNKFCASLAIAFIVSDEDLDEISKIKEIIPDITRLIAEAAEMISKNENVTRDFIGLDYNLEEKREICVVENMGITWSLLNLLNGLFYLSVNDKIKQEIYFNNHILDHLRLIVLKGNEIECEYSLKLLFQLCFDKEILNNFGKDKELIDYLNLLMNQKDDNSKKNLIKTASGILKLLNDSNNKNENVQISNFSPNNNEKQQNKHIMISYNRNTRDLCLKIKSELEKDGHKVWIDVEDIYGSSLDSMSFAIENSSCVLICMTEKYKQSNNCRLEGEYVVKTNKPFIPLIMQKDYDPDGWLGMMLGTKIFVHFMKYDFEECMRRLRSELGRVVNIPSQIIQISSNKNLDTKPTQKENKVVDWNKIEVNCWLNEKKIHPNIINVISNCDGKILYELYLIKKETPEFFYKYLNDVSLLDLAKFTSELKILFN